MLKITGFVKANAGKHLTIPEIAKHAGISERHVRRAFKAELGQSPVSIVQAEKIRRAKSLLLDTNLDISSIAFESGFENHTNFTKVFHEKAGLTPSAFRKQALALREMPQSEAADPDSEINGPSELYRDHFPGTALGPNWEAFHDQWKNRDGEMFSIGAEVGVGFLKPLPENCRITFDVLCERLPDLELPNFDVSLLDETHKAEYCKFTIASGASAAGHLGHYREGRKWNPQARVDENKWHTLALEIKEDTVQLLIDGKEAYFLRDSFPPAYHSRCYLHIGGWHCSPHIRRFVVQDLGFLPVTRPIRQGDALYNAGLPDKAREFYLRLLRSGTLRDSETMELRYKIGMCALRENAFSVAQDWIEKVVALKEDKFWYEQARLAVLEMHWRKADFESFRSYMQVCIEDPKTRDSARVVIQWVHEDLANRGFLDEAILILDAWLDHEQNDEFACETIHNSLSEYLLRSRRFLETEKKLATIIAKTNLRELQLGSMVNLMHLYCEWGKFAECERVRNDLRSRSCDSFTLARCRLNEAIALRSQENFDGALAIYSSLRHDFPLETYMIGHGMVNAAHIHCGLGNPSAARSIFQETKSVVPFQYLGSKEWLPVFLIEKDYSAAAEILTGEYQSTGNLSSAGAELGIKAGILWELASLGAKADALFREVFQRFPAEKVCFLGRLARALSSNEEIDIAGMPYEHFRRSELFYLVGRLKEVRGAPSAARTLFEMSLREDPTFRWPSHFSKRRLNQ